MDFVIGILEVFGILGAICLLIYGIYKLSRGAGLGAWGAVRPHSKKIGIGTVWIAAYIVCLWAFSEICPPIWHAWAWTKGFWITQLLIILIVCFILIKMNWPIWLLGILAVVLLITTVSNNYSKEPNKEATDASVKRILRPNLYSNDYWLNKPGDQDTVSIPYGYHLHTFWIEGAKSWGFAPEGATMEVVNGDHPYIDSTNLKNPLVTYKRQRAIISYAIGKVRVRCMLVKNGTCDYDKE